MESIEQTLDRLEKIYDAAVLVQQCMRAPGLHASGLSSAIAQLCMHPGAIGAARPIALAGWPRACTAARMRCLTHALPGRSPWRDGTVDLELPPADPIALAACTRARR